MPIIGNTYWAKLGRFPFWPAKIAAPEDDPDRDQKRTPGTTLVRFFGTGEYGYVKIADTHLKEWSSSQAGPSQKIPKAYQTAFMKAMTEAKQWTEGTPEERAELDRNQQQEDAVDAGTPAADAVTTAITAAVANETEDHSPATKRQRGAAGQRTQPEKKTPAATIAVDTVAATQQQHAQLTRPVKFAAKREFQFRIAAHLGLIAPVAQIRLTKV